MIAIRIGRIIPIISGLLTHKSDRTWALHGKARFSLVCKLKNKLVFGIWLLWRVFNEIANKVIANCDKYGPDKNVLCGKRLAKQTHTYL
jgi:hypothetical protein